METSCEICGDICEDELCEDCKYRMETGDISDIFARVQAHNNIEYEIDQLKEYISRQFDMPDLFSPGRKNDKALPRHFFIYFLARHFNMSSSDIFAKYSVTHCQIAYIRKKFDRKFQMLNFQKKYQHLTNFINFTLTKP